MHILLLDSIATKRNVCIFSFDTIFHAKPNCPYYKPTIGKHFFTPPLHVPLPSAPSGMLLYHFSLFSSSSSLFQSNLPTHSFKNVTKVLNSSSGAHFPHQFSFQIWLSECTNISHLSRWVQNVHRLDISKISATHVSDGQNLSLKIVASTSRRANIMFV